MIKNKDIKTVIPPLRFPEFKDAEGWQVTQLHNVSKRITQKNTHGLINRVLTNSALEGIVNQRDYFDKDIANQNNLEGYYIVKKGDYVYNPRISNIAPVGPLSKNRIETGVMSPLYTVFRFDNSSNDFYAQYFQSTNWHKYLKEVSNKGARFDRMSVTPNIFMDMPIPAPTIKEQETIAECLGSFDDLISAVADKIEALKEHKKGLMQQLFPAEGKTTPALRFPEFQNAGEWKETTLGKLFKIGNGKDYKHLNIGDISVYGSGGYMTSVDNYLYDGESVCIGRKGTIDKPMFLTGKFWTVDTLFYTHSFINCIPKFIYMYFQHINWLKHNEAGGVPSLSKTNIEKIKVVVPIDKKNAEQKKIADFLSSVDELISAETAKLDQLKVHKKGLMQQLFPIINE